MDDLMAVLDRLEWPNKATKYPSCAICGGFALPLIGAADPSEQELFGHKPGCEYIPAIKKIGDALKRAEYLESENKTLTDALAAGNRAINQMRRPQA